MEIWKEIQGYPEFEVSNKGRVRDVVKNSLRPLYKNKDGYMVVNIGRKHLIKQFRVNRLVATAFIPNPLGKTIVNHINSVRCDDSVENLEWCTQKENIHHAMIHGNFKTNLEGLNEKELNLMRYMKDVENRSYRYIARQFNKSHQTIINLLTKDKTL
jgi:hypothetical protein